MLLPIICQHLPLSELLHLLRSCRHLRLLNGEDATFSGVAWSAVKLELLVHEWLQYWTLPYDSCINDPHNPRAFSRIPLSLWQQAVPVIEYTLQQWGDKYASQVGSLERLQTTLRSKQPTTTLRIAGENHVVLSQLSHNSVYGAISRGFPCFRSRFVLTATPHLQHLHIKLNAYRISTSPLSDAVQYVPQLRSLHIENRGYFVGTGQPDAPSHAILAQLPHLTALTCVDLHINTQQLIDIAAHATLEHIHIDSCEAIPAFHTDGESVEQSESEERAERVTASHDSGATDYAAAADEASHELDPHERDIRQLSLALTRVTPTRRSIVARLELAHSLHIAVHREKLDISTEQQRLRKQVAVLQSTLRRQLAWVRIKN